MFSRSLYLLLAALLALPLGLPLSSAQAQTSYTHEIIIYGGGFQGVAAALNAQDTYRYLKGGASARILLINPFSALGGLGTINGQNFYDIRTWNGSQPQQGNHIKFFNQFGQFYSTGEMANWLQSQINAKGGITVLQPHDITSVARNTTTGRITSVTVQKLARSNQAWIFDSASAPATYTAPVFIDASENGRLTWKANIGTTLGRQDRNTDRRQMVASLMFKVRGIDIQAIKNAQAAGKRWAYTTDSNGSEAFYGGQDDLADTTKTALQSFNRNYPRYQIKAMNAAEDRYSGGSLTGNDEYWINTLLIFGVDGRCERKDNCADQTTYPDGSTAWSVEYAFAQARAMMVPGSDFTNALKQMTGFANFQYVTINVGGVNYPVVGESLYLRETIHTPLSTAGSGESNYALTASEVSGAGATSTTGTDTGNFSRRIGLSFYYMDTNGYTKSFNGSFWTADPDPNPYAQPSNPVYLPIDTLLTSQAPNLLLPGYSANIGSWAWAEARVLPNLTVLGDAAGVSAAYAVHSATDPYNFPSTTITNIQNRIVALGGRINK
jgi:hypothetical protein